MVERLPPPVMSEVREKQPLHDEIERHIAEFLAKGGVIQRLKFGESSGVDTCPHVNQTRAARARARFELRRQEREGRSK